jgi:hypothetical protein
MTVKEGMEDHLKVISGDTRSQLQEKEADTREPSCHLAYVRASVHLAIKCETQHPDEGLVLNRQAGQAADYPLGFVGIHLQFVGTKPVSRYLYT